MSQTSPSSSIPPHRRGVERAGPGRTPHPYVPPPVPSEAELAPRPGGLRRFAIALVLAGLLLSGVVVGLIAWMKATQRPDPLGPQELKYPEKRPFRR